MTKRALLVELLMLTNINPCVHGPSWIGLWSIFQPNPTFLGGEITNATHSSFKNHQIYHVGIKMELCWVVDLGHRPKNWVIIQLFTPIVKERSTIYTIGSTILISSKPKCENNSPKQTLGFSNG